jgi:lipoprotein-releasing system permease protein
MSRLPFELLLALRYLRPKRTYVSIITLISIIGVMLGVAVLIIVISVMSGFDKQLREKILGFNAHLRITPAHSTLRNYLPIASIVASNNQVKGVAPFIVGPVLMETQPDSGSSQVSAPYIRGIDPKAEVTVSILPTSIITGQYDVSGKGLLVGSELAQMLKLEVGDVVAIHSPRNLQKMRDSNRKNKNQDNREDLFLPDDYVVRGIFDVGYFEYNSSVILCSLANAQDLYDLNDSVHGLLVMLNDPYKANQVRAELEPLLGRNFSIKTWSEENSGIMNALIVEKNVMFYILFFIMIVAAFGITSALITFVVQKTREIGLLKALGATRAQILWLFLSQSVLVGILGVLAGFGLGMLALTYRNQFLHFMNRVTGFELFPASVYNFQELPALIMPRDIAVICGVSLLFCVVAGLLPAWNASRMHPVEALRHE